MEKRRHDRIRQTRFKASICAFIILSIALFSAIYKGLDGIGVACATAIGGLLASYNWGETTRSSV